MAWLQCGFGCGCCCLICAAGLLSGPMDAGAHNVTWGGENADSAPTQPGVYMLRLQTAQGTVTKKLVLQR